MEGFWAYPLHQVIPLYLVYLTKLEITVYIVATSLFVKLGNENQINKLWQTNVVSDLKMEAFISLTLCVFRHTIASKVCWLFTARDLWVTSVGEWEAPHDQVVHRYGGRQLRGLG